MIQNFQLSYWRKTLLIMTVVLFAVATLFLVLHITTSSRPEGYADGVGVIDHITTEVVHHGDSQTTNYHYFVKYTYEEVEYINELQNYAGSFNVGDTVQLLINIENPNIIRNLGTDQGNFNSLMGCIIIYIIDVVFAGLTVTAFIMSKKQKQSALQ